MSECIGSHAHLKQAQHGKVLTYHAHPLPRGDGFLPTIRSVLTSNGVVHYRVWKFQREQLPWGKVRWH